MGGPFKGSFTGSIGVLSLETLHSTIELLRTLWAGQGLSSRPSPPVVRPPLACRHPPVSSAAGVAQPKCSDSE